MIHVFHADHFHPVHAHHGHAIAAAAHAATHPAVFHRRPLHSLVRWHRHSRVIHGRYIAISRLFRRLCHSGLHRLERHPTQRANPRPGLHNLRMHGTRVGQLRRCNRSRHLRIGRHLGRRLWLSGKSGNASRDQEDRRCRRECAKTNTHLTVLSIRWGKSACDTTTASSSPNAPDYRFPALIPALASKSITWALVRFPFASKAIPTECCAG